MSLRRTLNWRARLKPIGALLEAEGRLCDRENRFVGENLDRLHEAGLFTLGVPEAFGGGGADIAELCAMIRAVGRHDGSTALALSMHTHQVAVAEWRRSNSGAPTEGLLRAVGEGKRLLSSGGSDWLAGSGRAEKVDGGYRIHARKVFSSGAPAGDMLLTCAIHEDPQSGPTVLHFAVPMSAPEVSIVEIWDVMGMRGTASHDVVIDGLFIPEEKVTGRRPAGKWHPLFHIISMIAIPLIYSAYAGVADGLRDSAIAMAKKRPAEPATISVVGELETAHAGVDVIHARMAHIANSGAPSPETTNQVMQLRTLISRFVLKTSTKAMETAGGAGFYRDKGLEQRFRDAQAARYHPLQAGPQAAYAGRMALGLDIDG